MNKLKLLLALFLVSLVVASCTKEALKNLPPIVNAEEDTTIDFRKSTSDTIQLNGEAIDKDGSVTTYLWSEVSGPNTVTIITPGSKSTLVAGVTSGTYVFQLMATDNKGATGVKTVSVTVIASKTVNITLQPFQNPDDVHVWGNETNLEGSYSGAPELGAATWTYQGDVVYQRGLIEFDLRSIPADATILSAKLSLFSNPVPLNGDLVHANCGPDNTTLIQRVTTSWIPSEVKWRHQPTATDENQIIIPHTDKSFLDLIDVDVTSLVQTMAAANTNNGFLIRLKNEVVYNSRLFCSSYNSNASKRPKLVVQYSR